MDHAATYREGAASDDPQHSRRSSWSLRQSIRFRVSVAGGAWVCGALYQSTRVYRIWREISVGDVGRMGEARLSGRDGGGRLCMDPSSCVSEAPGGHGLFVWRIFDGLGHHANDSLRGGGQRGGDFQLDERLWHVGYSTHQGERILWDRVESGSSRTDAGAIADNVRGQCQDAYTVRAWRGGYAGAD